MIKYEDVIRVQRIRVSNRRGLCIAEGQESKVYRVSARRYPSGSKYVLLVWSAELGRCVWVREDDVEVLVLADVKIHSF